LSNATLQFHRDCELGITAWKGTVLIDGWVGIALTFSSDTAEEKCRSMH